MGASVTNNRSLHTKSCHSQHSNLKNQAKSQHCNDRLVISERVLARWWRLVAFMKAVNLLHQAMRAVSYYRIAPAIKMASKGGGDVAHRCVDCVPGGRRGNTEQVVTRWQSLVAFMKALDLLHRSMSSVFHQRTAWLSKWPAMEVHLFAAPAYFDCCNRS